MQYTARRVNAIFGRLVAVTAFLLCCSVVSIVRGDLNPASAGEIATNASVTMGHQEFLLSMHGFNFMFPLVGLLVIIFSLVGLVLLSRKTHSQCVSICVAYTAEIRAAGPRAGVPAELRV
ncbi:MAG: hypothetical protein Q3972_07420 [Corynebacterium sp.]|nr:hypothetical protein [Corynebacterium sp.]